MPRRDKDPGTGAPPRRRPGADAPPDAGPDAVSVFRAACAYVGFTRRDSALLASFHPEVAPRIGTIVDDFYARIEKDPSAARVITGGSAQTERLKGTLRGWLTRFLTGPHDARFAEMQAQIGRRHVNVGLDQMYMVTGLNIFREHLTAILFRGGGTRRRLEIQRAFTKLLDVVLVQRLETYREDSLARILHLEQHAKTRRLAALGEVAASLAHEIRNPLAGISGAIQVLSQDLDPAAPRAEVIREILREVRRLDAKVNDLLVYARPLHLEREPVRPRQMLEETLRLLAEDARLKKVRIRLAASPLLPPFPLDRGHVRQVLVNLLLNAAQAVDGLGVVRLAARARSGNLEISVHDSGGGVPAHLQEEIFRPFFTTRAEGTGLGLPISRKIVEAHGGSLRVERPPGGGARFVCTFPPPMDDPSGPGANGAL